MVLALMGILSAGATALLTSRDDFTPVLVKDQLIATLRLAQQSAMSKTQTTTIAHSVSASGDNFVFVVSGPGGTSTRQVESEGTAVTWSTTALSGACSTVTGVLPHSVAFDARGDAVATRYCINGGSEYSVCVSSLGFAYEGVCET
jgi:MSHA pilin protein MshC